MLLKCRYLAQFSMSELTKNPSQFSKAAQECPFMKHAKSTLSTIATPPQTIESSISSTTSTTTTTNTNNIHNHGKKIKSRNHSRDRQQQQQKCTDTINCPFFQNSNIDLKKILIKERNLSDDTRTNIESSINPHQHQRINDINKQRQAKGMSNSHSRRLANQQQQQQQQQSQSFDYENFFQQKIDAKINDGSYRYFKKVSRHASKFPIVNEHTCDKTMKDITIWCSNDYLGLGRHPKVQSKVIQAINKYGTGSGGTRNISGSTPLHSELESRLAQFHQKESALVFTSCYVANDTTLYTLAKMLPNCFILSDSGNHASMIQGIRNSGMPKKIFRHNDLEHLESELKKLPLDMPKIVAFESVHSMDGSVCELEKMCDVTHKYGGIAFIDEVHAVGLYGGTGAGIGERDNCLHKMDIISGTLGKAFGNIGGYIAGSSRFVDTMRSYGSGFIFTTSLPPSVAAGALASIEISSSDEGRELRAKHQLNATIVKERLIEAGLPVMDNPSHIVPVMVGDANAAAEICDLLIKENSIYIQSINYPTVARGEERLRIVPNPHHTDEMIDQLVNSVVDAWKKTVAKYQPEAVKNFVTK